MNKYKIEFAVTGMVTTYHRNGYDNETETIEMTQQGKGSVVIYGEKISQEELDLKIRNQLYGYHWTRYDAGKLKGILKLVISEVEMEIEIDTYRLEPLRK